jgi:hypothetical protein
MAEKNRKAKAGVPRTEVFAMRLDPKLKYLAEIAARKQRRSLANFVEWAIEEALKGVPLSELDLNGNGPTVANVATQLWALDEPDRLRNLATHYPELLSYDEQLVWRVINEHSTYDRAAEEISRFVGEKSYDDKLIRACWPEIKAYALEGGTLEKLDEVVLFNDENKF